MSESNATKPNEIKIYYYCDNCGKLSELRLKDVCPNCGKKIEPVELDIKLDERYMV